MVCRMAETLFYDVHPERDPEELLTKFVTTAGKIESACPQQLELSEEPTGLKGGSDEPAVEEGEVPLDDEGKRMRHRSVLAATRNLRCIADTGSALHVRSLDDIPMHERQNGHRGLAAHDFADCQWRNASEQADSD